MEERDRTSPAIPPHPTYPPTLGARLLADGKCCFRVWAPKAERVDLKIVAPTERVVPMQSCDRGYFEIELDGVSPGTRYLYRLDDERDRPDPASRFQPDGVNQASAVVDPHFAWTDEHWHGLPLHQYITYELHVGTFTPAGTFEAIIDHLDDLRDLGVTAIELMPVAQFPGGRNWGYDGVHPFAAQNTYGGPDGLRRLVDAAHARGLAIIMDVVYNHVGPEGNYLAEFGHYFTDRHHTPWGEAVNFDDRDSDEVRRFFIENALYWVAECHVDALRLDAVHAIFDFTAQPFLQELADAVRTEGERLNRRVHTIAESSLGDPGIVEPKELGGCGIDGQWCDDLHHAIRTELTDEQSGYYTDYRGFDDIVKAYRNGFVQDGVYSQYRGRRHGAPARHIDPIRLVVFSQNHDQVGNRLFGERLTELVSREQMKLAAACVILSPFQPMLFMGEEYGEPANFQFFISHLDPNLVEAVRQGRKEEFARFQWQQEPPDPQDEATFQRCKLNHALKEQDGHRSLRQYYKRLIQFRKTEAALAFPSRDRMEITVLDGARAFAVRRWARASELAVLFNFHPEASDVTAPLPAGAWSKALSSADTAWGGPGDSLAEQLESPGEASLTLPPHSVAIYRKPN